MTEPYSPGGEHCPKCGYRHDGRCAEAQCQCGHTLPEHYADFCGGCQCRKFVQAEPAEEWTPLLEVVDLTKMPGYRWGYEAGYGEAQKAIDRLRNFARLLWAYNKSEYETLWPAQTYLETVAEARALDIENGLAVAVGKIDRLQAEYDALATEIYTRHMTQNGSWSWESREDWPAITRAMDAGRALGI